MDKLVSGWVVLIGLLLIANPVVGAGTAPASQSTSSTMTDLKSWDEAQDVNSPEGYRAYLRAFPNGAFAAIAATRTSAALLTDMLPVAPKPDNAQVQVEMATARTAWDNAAWARVSAANTHAAYREYLLHLPTGAYSQQALTAYRASMPASPGVRLPDCRLADTDAKKIRDVDIRRAYPDFAIERWTDGIVIGQNHIDYTGKVLGTTIDYASNPTMFANGARVSAAQMQFVPKVVNCMAVPDITRVQFRYIMGDLPYESRQNSDGANLQATTNTELRSQLPGDRALLISFTPAPGVSVYEIEFNARFPYLLTQIVPERTRPLPLVSNKMFLTASGEPITLRVSAPDKPNSRKQNMGPFRMTIRQVHNQPN